MKEDLLYWKEKTLDFLIEIKTLHEFTSLETFRRNLILKLQELSECDDVFFIKKEDDVSEKILLSTQQYLEDSYTNTSFLNSIEASEKGFVYHEDIYPPTRSHFLVDKSSVIFIPLNETHIKGSIILTWNLPSPLTEGKEYFIRICLDRIREVLRINYMIFSLEELRIKFSTVFHSVSQGLIFIDEGDNSAWINSKGKQLLNIYAPGEYLSPIIISEHMKLFREHAQNEDEIREIAMELFSKPDKEVTNWIWKFTNNIYRVSSIPTISDRTKGRLWIFEDISEIYFANQKLADTNEEIKAANNHLSEQNALILSQNEEIQTKNSKLEAINQEKNGLINVVSHDLKSPFQQIQGMANIIEMICPMEGDQKVFIENIKAVSKKGLNLVKDILDISALEQQKAIMKEELLDLPSFISSELKLFQVLADKKDIKVHFTDYAESKLIITDPDYLRRILENLMSNAVKFSYNGKNIFIEIRNSEDNIVISIRDEGQGMTEVDKKHLYEKFKKLSARPTGGESSTGLGLSIVKALVEQMNGKITCESEWGKGTTFILEFSSFKNEENSDNQ